MTSTAPLLRWWTRRPETGELGDYKAFQRLQLAREAKIENLALLYKETRATAEAIKAEAGKLKGKTDINPMWRIKVLTETFGPCGEGWKTENTQLVVLPVAYPDVVQAEEITGGPRGDDGYGSTGR